MEEEIWKSLDFMGYPDYEVSNMGRVKSFERNGTKGGILKPSKAKGYLRVVLCKNNKVKSFFTHRLVALAFIPNDNPIKKTQINHLDENKENNHVSNLCWCSCIDNNNYGTRNERASNSLKGKYIGKNNWNYGKHRSEETKQKISETKKDKPQYKHRKPILQYTKDGIFIRYWDSAKSASKELKIDATSIGKCCMDKLKTSGGFIWRYKENNTNLVIS